MAISDDYLEFVADQLSGFGQVVTRKMFGGAGLYLEGIMFGLISPDNKLYLKADDTNRRDYEEVGMGPFVPTFSKPVKRTMEMPYYEVPGEVLEDREELQAWAGKAYVVAQKGKRK
jgi:DNA transformation protein